MQGSSTAICVLAYCCYAVVSAVRWMLFLLSKLARVTSPLSPSPLLPADGTTVFLYLVGDVGISRSHLAVPSGNVLLILELEHQYFCCIEFVTSIFFASRCFCVCCWNFKFLSSAQIPRAAIESFTDYWEACQILAELINFSLVSWRFHLH